MKSHQQKCYRDLTVLSLFLKKNVGKATKANKGKDSAADKYDEETTTVKKVPEVKPENVETNGVAAKGKKERGKKAGKKDTVFK
jgi:hypothetical protein